MTTPDKNPGKEHQPCELTKIASVSAKLREQAKELDRLVKIAEGRGKKTLVIPPKVADRAPLGPQSLIRAVQNRLNAPEAEKEQGAA